MADLDYILSHLYGFEPYVDNAGAGGARFTGQNLIVTAWNVAVDLGNDPLAAIGTILKPISENDNVDVVKRVAGTQAMHSRCSAEFFLENDPEAKTPIVRVLLVANPPPELRQQLVEAVTYNGGNPALLSSYAVSRSLQGCYVWAVRVWNTDNASENIFTSQSYDFITGTYLPLGNYGGVETSSLPFLKTSGADGQTPQFFDRTTVQGVQEMIESINDGVFYVPIIVEGLDLPAPHVKVEWPHSVARG